MLDNARSNIAEIVEIRLPFVAQPQIDGQIRPYAPVITDERSDILLMNGNKRITRANREL